MTPSKLAISAAVLAALGLAPAAANAAGPCTDQIAKLGRQLGSMTGLGAPVSEPGAGQQVDKNAGANAGATPSDRSQPGGANREAGGSPGTVGGAAGPGGTAVTSGQVATSPEDVRRQSEGKPTQAAAAASGKAGQESGAEGDKVSMAKSDLQKATDLNSKNDDSCKTFIQHAENLMKGS